jgi:cytochrome c1
MEARKHLGFMTLLYLAVFTLMLYLVKKKIWAGVPH